MHLYDLFDDSGAERMHFSDSDKSKVRGSTWVSTEAIVTDFAIAKEKKKS